MRMALLVNCHYGGVRRVHSDWFMTTYDWFMTTCEGFMTTSLLSCDDKFN